MKTSRLRPLVALAALVLLIAPTGGTARATTGPDITFCKIEANGSWEILTVDYTWILNGYQFQKGNIIPPFFVEIGEETISFPGLNLDTVYPSGHTGQEILDNGCEVPPPAPPTTTTVPPTTVPPTTAPPTTEPPDAGPPATTTPPTTAPPTTDAPPAAPPAPPTTDAPPAPPTTDPPGSSPPSGGAPPRQSEPPVEPPDGPDLPNTGSGPMSGVVGAALTLLFAGSVLQVLSQRRRAS